MDTLTIGPSAFSTGKWAKNRVSWNILGEEIFFESDVLLEGHAEAVGTAVFLQAMRNNLEFSVEDEVCKEWTGNLERIMPLANGWWGLSPVPIRARTKSCAPQADGCATFFTAGVDSFYTLLRGQDQITTLVYVIGFDIGLEDTGRLNKAREWIHEVAKSRRLKIIEVATNLKAHPFFRTLRWGDHTHGAALAAVGHTLDGHLSELRIASTDASGRPRGSNPELDHLWSSGRLGVKYDSPGVSRLDKIRCIVGEPLIRRYLRVCWENRDEELNCGRCEKCVRTQAQLWAVDPDYFLDQSCFPPGDVPGKVNGLASVPIHIFNQWRDIFDAAEDPDLKSAIERLFKRSDRAERVAGHMKAMKWYGKKLRRMLGM